MTFDDILIEQDTEMKISARQVLDEIKDMISCALSTVKKCLALGTITLSLMSLSTAPESLIIENSETTVQLDINQPQPSIDLSIASISAAQIRLEKELGQLCDLETGWDDSTASKPKPAAIKQASMLISQLDDNVLSSCTLFPSNDSGIYLQGKLTNGKLSIFMDGEVMAYIVKGKDSKLSSTAKVNADTINYLNQGLKMYV